MSGTAGLLGWSWIFVRLSASRIEPEAIVLTAILDHRRDVHRRSRRGSILRSVVLSNVPIVDGRRTDDNSQFSSTYQIRRVF